LDQQKKQNKSGNKKEFVENALIKGAIPEDDISIVHDSNKNDQSFQSVNFLKAANVYQKSPVI